jgi:rhodanese-related sulfurtransferase
MSLLLTSAGVATLCLLVSVWVTRVRAQREIERHSISPEDLHSLQSSGQEVLLFDVRQPLDLLAYPEIIPGARRIPPNEVIEKPSLIPSEKDAVVYCTCPSDKTSRLVLRRALALNIRRIKFLRGGLAGWKTKGYPVEPYREAFHLYAPSVTSRLPNF